MTGQPPDVARPRVAWPVGGSRRSGEGFCRGAGGTCSASPSVDEH